MYLKKYSIPQNRVIRRMVHENHSLIRRHGYYFFRCPFQCRYYLRAVFISLESPLTSTTAGYMCKLRMSDAVTTVRCCKQYVRAASKSCCQQQKRVVQHKQPQHQPVDRHQDLFAYVCMCHIYQLWLQFEAGIYFAQSFQLCGYYSKVACIQINTVYCRIGLLGTCTQCAKQRGSKVDHASKV